MQKLRIKHPREWEVGVEFEFCEDGTYVMINQKGRVLIHAEWKLMDVAGQPDLFYKNFGSEWKSFFSTGTNAMSRAMAEKLLSWITDRSLLGGDSYVIEN